MLRLFSHTFSRIYFFYQEVLLIKKDTHYHASFVLALLMFANIYVVINGFTVLASGRIGFDYRSPIFILIGNALVLSVIILMSIKQRYKILAGQTRTLSMEQKKRLDKSSDAYVMTSVVLLLAMLLCKVLLPC